METTSVTELMAAARSGEREPLGDMLKLYQNYLLLLATTQLDRRLQRRVSPSDLVQETMLAAHRDFHQFRGGSEREFLGWLRQVLINCLHHAVDTHVKAKKRDIRCEVSLDFADSVERSVEALAHRLADRGPTPSAAVRQRERSVELADRLAQLKPEYREVIVLRNLQGLSFEEVAERMDRKPGTARMLWLRAMDKLKQTALVDE